MHRGKAERECSACYYLSPVGAICPVCGRERDDD